MNINDDNSLVDLDGSQSRSAEDYDTKAIDQNPQSNQDGQDSIVYNIERVVNRW